MSGEPRADRNVGLRWLVTVRWVASCTQLVAAVSIGLLGGAVPLLSSLACVVPVLLTNLWLARRGEEVSARTVLGLLLLDVASLSAWLVLAGGPSNPWSALYLVYVVLASLLLEDERPFVVVVACALGYGATFVLAPHEGGDHSAHGGSSAFDSHLEGMYVAYVVSSALVAFFVTRVAASLREHERALAAARERAAKVDRIAALTTLAAGAAHELGSPLATIAIAAKELERSLAASGASGELVDDARLVRDEVARCRTILDRMALRAGTVVGAAPARVALRSLDASLRESLGGRFERVRRTIADDEVALPERALHPIVDNLVRNALDASTAEVGLEVRSAGDVLRIVVVDEGIGMDEPTRKRALDPFFTTKEPGLGMGLGLFLVDTLVHELGGTLELDSAPGRGTRATVSLPLGGGAA